ncbi:MAG: branched-chain amino acid ABC transporter permease [Desulfurococcaceae archaeon]
METALILQSLLEGVLNGSVYALVALGLGLIWGVTEIVNFAHGDFLMLSAFIVYFLHYYFGLGPIEAIPICFAINFLLGYALQRLLINRIIEAHLLAQTFTTFALALIIRNSFYVALGPDVKSIANPLAVASINIMGIRLSAAKIVATAVAAALTLALYMFLKRTYIGTAIRAIAQNRAAAQLMGVNTKQTYSISTGIAVGLAGVAGALIASYYYIFPEIGPSFTILAFVAVVLGGIGSIHGAAIGALIVGLLQNIGALVFVPALKDVLVFFIFVAFLAIKPTGLFGD